MSTIRTRTIQGLKAGDTFKVTRTFSEEDVLRFADITRDYNPVHFDDRFAGTKNLSGRICHGLLVGSLLTEIGGQIGWLASTMTFRFKVPVFFGDTVTCALTITEIDSENRARARAEFTNQQGAVVLQAELGGILPGEPQRKVLKAMVAEGDPTNKVC
jgi:acyl dehydratase